MFSTAERPSSTGTTIFAHIGKADEKRSLAISGSVVPGWLDFGCLLNNAAGPSLAEPPWSGLLQNTPLNAS